MSAFVEVALLTNAFDQTLSYRVPDAMQAQAKVGVIVGVPLRNTLTTGIIIHHWPPNHKPTDDKGQRLKFKSLHSLIDPQPALNAQQIALARWIAAEYYTSIGRACAMMIPPGLTPSSANVYEALTPPPPTNNKNSPETLNPQTEIFNLLRGRGPATEAKLRSVLRKMGVTEWHELLEGMVKKGLIARASTLAPPKVSVVRKTLVQLMISAVTFDIVLGNLDRDDKAPARRRAAALRYLQHRNGIAWADWLSAETSATSADLAWLQAQDYVTMGDAERWRDPLSDLDFVLKTPPPLTPDQAAAWQAVRMAIENQEARAKSQESRVKSQESRAKSQESRIQNTDEIVNSPITHSQFLLRGVTGSGKTEVYLRAVEATLAKKRGVIILVPEISLTPQTARRFLERFPGKVALIHSRLRPGERFDTWRRIRSGELPVVVGARSALFAPVPNVGLIVLDEEHESSYKQDKSPAYDARRVAAHYAKMSNAVLIYGSATPSLEVWHAVNFINPNPETQMLKLLELPNRVRAHANRVADQQARLGIKAEVQPERPTPEITQLVYQPLPDVQVVDMRAELRAGNTSMFSVALRDSLLHTFSRGEQAIIFLNRRGLASCVVCRDCGHAVRCPNDDVPLTLHSAPSAQVLKCHHCNHSEPVPKLCPACKSPRIRYIGIGTQRIEQAIHELHPKARIVRWDKDTASSRGAEKLLLERFMNQQADIMVGTQMIAKGLDLPMVTLVGVVLADVGLFLPDFRASERVFNLIEQVAGRAGRGLLKGRVIVQTYNPDHPSIAHAKHHDVQGFAKYELSNRRMLDLPPFTRLVRFEFEDESEDKARQQCEALGRQLRQVLAQPSSLIGPAPAYFARRNKRFRWHIIARTDSPRILLAKLNIPSGCFVDVDPTSLL